MIALGTSLSFTLVVGFFWYMSYSVYIKTAILQAETGVAAETAKKPSSFSRFKASVSDSWNQMSGQFFNSGVVSTGQGATDAESDADDQAGFPDGFRASSTDGASATGTVSGTSSASFENSGEAENGGGTNGFEPAEPNYSGTSTGSRPENLIEYGASSSGQSGN